MVGLVAVEFEGDVGDGAHGGVDEGGETAVLVGIQCVFAAVDVGHEAAQADAGDGEFVGEVELLGVGEEVGVFVFTDGGAVEAVFDGVTVGEGRAVADGMGGCRRGLCIVGCLRRRGFCRDGRRPCWRCRLS